jgi:CSLREA domain-containing protein
MRLRPPQLALLAVAWMTFGAGVARAATLTVTTTQDTLAASDGECSLREALAAAESPGAPGDCGTASGRLE